MKNRRKTLIIFLLAMVACTGTIAYIRYAIRQRNLQNAIGHMPNVTLYTPQGNAFYTQSMEPGRRVLLIYFNTECHLCKDEVFQIKRNHKALEDVDILLVSSQLPEELLSYTENQNLQFYHNIRVLSDRDLQAMQLFKIRLNPTSFVYNKEHVLAGTFEGKTSINTILSALGL
ncbi:MAG: redoxin domain-containing protein [Flavobacteriales bacterium]|nr:redoxin domain-containing protein [Flavobacteriales bacterium]MCB9448928.1 redoxin domain-containing protein [Flavobacteriales bacterium]